MNEKPIWDYLSAKIRNPYGVAGLMGNLYAESSLNPVKGNNVKKKTGLTDIEYTAVTDANRNDNFATDGIAYGLAQWCYHTRKLALLKMAREQGKSVGDLTLQLDYLWYELNQYKTVLNTLYSAKSVKEASDIVMLKYERPANTSDAAKDKRCQYGMKYFQMFSDNVTAKLSKKSAKELLVKLDNALKRK